MVHLAIYNLFIVPIRFKIKKIVNLMGRVNYFFQCWQDNFLSGCLVIGSHPDTLDQINHQIN